MLKPSKGLKRIQKPARTTIPKCFTRIARVHEVLKLPLNQAHALLVQRVGEETKFGISIAFGLGLGLLGLALGLFLTPEMPRVEVGRLTRQYRLYTLYEESCPCRGTVSPA